MVKPTPQASLGPWFDDDAISDHDRLLRVTKLASVIVQKADGTFGVSDQVFTTSGGGCSTDLFSLFEADGVSPAERVARLSGYGALTVSVGDVRSTDARAGGEGGQEPLGVAHTPIREGEAHGPNPYHCDVFPKLGNPGRKRLFEKCAVVVEIDQEVARRLWTERMREKEKSQGR